MDERVSKTRVPSDRTRCGVAEDDTERDGYRQQVGSEVERRIAPAHGAVKGRTMKRTGSRRKR